MYNVYCISIRYTNTLCVYLSLDRIDNRGAWLVVYMYVGREVGASDGDMGGR